MLPRFIKYSEHISNNTAKILPGTLPVGGSGINYIATSNTDPNKLWSLPWLVIKRE